VGSTPALLCADWQPLASSLGSSRSLIPPCEDVRTRPVPRCRAGGRVLGVLDQVARRHRTTNSGASRPARIWRRRPIGRAVDGRTLSGGRSPPNTAYRNRREHLTVVVVEEIIDPTRRQWDPAAAHPTIYPRPRRHLALRWSSWGFMSRSTAEGVGVIPRPGQERPGSDGATLGARWRAVGTGSEARWPRFPCLNDVNILLSHARSIRQMQAGVRV
jgi:hypothetical protein